MGKEKLTIDENVVAFVRELKANFRIEKILFFGSRATGEALKDSDYDFVIVSPDFKNIFFTERTKMLYRYWNLPQALEALCYTPEEFTEKASQITIVREAVRKGIDVTAA